MNFQRQLACFVFLLCLGRLSSLEDPFETCSRYTSFGYGYRDFFEFRNGNFSANQIFYLEFFVKTSSDAHVLLQADASADEGYEIVIGGGSNTFSQIRLVQPEMKKTMITQKTENFLSADDYQHFWISIDKLGIISVGKKEDDEVFINWRFDNPIPVKYFSFGSWTNMKADWRFGCERQKNSGVIHEEGKLSPLRKLKRDLFTFYNPNTLPVEKRATLEVKINFQVVNVQLNEKRGELTMYGYGDLKWMDAKIRWKPENYNGIKTIYVPPFQIWTPSIRVLNALAFDKTPLFDLTAAGVMANYDGSIFWRPPFKSVSSCTVNLENWPFDAHNCSVFFGFWMEPPNLVLTVMKEYQQTLTEERAETGWEELEIIPFNTEDPDEDDNYGLLYVQLRRSYATQSLILTVPYIVAVTLSLTSFWVPLKSSFKLHLSCGSLVILLLTLFLAGASVPAMTQTVPKIMSLYSWSAVIACFPIIVYVILKNVEVFAKVPEFISKYLSSSSFLDSIFCLPDLSMASTEYSNLNEEVNKLNKDRLGAIRLLAIIDRIFFLLYLVALLLLVILI